MRGSWSPFVGGRINGCCVGNSINLVIFRLTRDLSRTLNRLDVNLHISTHLDRPHRINFSAVTSSNFSVFGSHESFNSENAMERTAGVYLRN
jgi:hypothetical protein